ncbi:MAG: tyrosine recombinase XerC [Clostridia bacterium]|nr:tyrosine recombinase XerC [Clostridia bacterium]
MDMENNPSYLNSFLDYSLTILNKSPNTVKEYNYDLNTFLKYIMHKNKISTQSEIKDIIIKDLSIEEIQKITLDDIHSFLFYLSNSFNSKPATRARKVSCIRVFFKYLALKKLIPINPAQNLETPKLEKRMPKYLTLEDSEKLLHKIQDNDKDRNKIRDFAIVTLFLNCGMRLSELVGINIKDIDFYDLKLNVIGKGNKERTIYLNTACEKVLKDYLDIRPRDGVKFNSRDALFLSERKERISNRTVQYIVKQELQRAGLDVNKYSVHKLRHTAATLMYQYGNVDIRALQELLGHESIATTQIYTHVNNKQIRDAVESNPLSSFNKQQK